MTYIVNNDSSTVVIPKPREEYEAETGSKSQLENCYNFMPTDMIDTPDYVEWLEEKYITKGIK